MGQIKLHSRMPLADARRLFDTLEATFEDEGLPLAIREIDEEKDIHEMSVYLQAEDEAEDEADVRARLESETQALGLSHTFETEILPDIDWVTKSLEGLKPVRAGRFLVHGSHDRDQRRIGDITIEIEAGLAFGTGHHGTTSGCLEMIDRVVRREHPRNALDLGTGSAVLAIGLAKLAHIPVLATDIDPIATRVAAENARLNGVARYVDCRTTTGFHHQSFGAYGPFDLIVANILARPLMRLAPQMVRPLVPGGSLILSGILERQREAVIAAYVGQHFRHVATLHLEGWVTLHLKR